MIGEPPSPPQKMNRSGQFHRLPNGRCSLALDISWWERYGNVAATSIATLEVDNGDSANGNFTIMGIDGYHEESTKDRYDITKKKRKMVMATHTAGVTF